MNPIDGSTRIRVNHLQENDVRLKKSFINDQKSQFLLSNISTLSNGNPTPDIRNRKINLFKISEPSGIKEQIFSNYQKVKPYLKTLIIVSGLACISFMISTTQASISTNLALSEEHNKKQMEWIERGQNFFEKSYNKERELEKRIPCYQSIAFPPEAEYTENLISNLIPGRAFENLEKAHLDALKLSKQSTKIEGVEFHLDSFILRTEGLLEDKQFKMCYGDAADQKVTRTKEIAALYFTDLKFIQGDDGLSEDNLSYFKDFKDVPDILRYIHCTPLAKKMLNDALEQFRLSTADHDSSICKVNASVS